VEVLMSDAGVSRDEAERLTAARPFGSPAGPPAPVLHALLE
jgi:hypothetical protein